MSDVRDQLVGTVRDRLAELEYRASECRALLVLLGAEEDPSESAGVEDAEERPEPAPRRPARTGRGAAVRRPADGPNEAVHHNTAARLLRQLAMAKYLRDHERATPREIAAGCSLAPGSVSRLLDHEWFERVGPHRQDPWRLSDAGRAAIDRQAG